VPGLLDGEHTLTIKPLEEDRVRFVLEETFGGPARRLFPAT
jgi:hypothetical protein